MNTLTEEQRSTIYRRLSQMNLDDFQDFFEEVIKSEDYALGLSFVNAIKNKVEVQMRMKLVELQNMRLQGITGGLTGEMTGGFIKCIWRDGFDRVDS